MISSSEAVVAGLNVGFMLCTSFLSLSLWLVLAIITIGLFVFKLNDFKKSVFLKVFLFISISIGLLAGIFPALFLSVMSVDSSSTPAMVGYLVFGAIEVMTGLAGLVFATPIAYAVYSMKKTKS